MNTYPYPVLRPEESSYLDSVSFNLEYKKSEIVSNEVQLTLLSTMNCNYLNDLLTTDQARIIVRVQTELLSFVSAPVSLDHPFVITIPTESLRLNDTIALTALIILSQSLDYKWNSELLDIYPQDLSIKLRSNDVLAVSNEQKLDYAAVNPDFIRFHTVDSQEGNGIRVSLGKENFIEVWIGPSMDRAYRILRRNQKVSLTFGSHIIFETLTFALLEIIQDRESYLEKTWYQTLDRLISSTIGESLEEFCEGFEQGYIDIGKVFDVAQKMMNNQIERSLITLSTQEVEV